MFKLCSMRRLKTKRLTESTDAEQQDANRRRQGDRTLHTSKTRDAGIQPQGVDRRSVRIRGVITHGQNERGRNAVAGCTWP